MSAEAERVFSGARRTISWDRARLSARTIERLECLKNWLKSKLSHGVFLAEGGGVIGAGGVGLVVERAEGGGCIVWWGEMAHHWQDV